jgi:hypothetical protein
MASCCGEPARHASDQVMKVITTSFPAGSVQRRDFERAVATWNDVRGSWFDWTVAEDDDDTLCDECDGSEAGFFDRAPDWGVLGWTSVDVDDVLCSWPVCDGAIEGADISFFVHDKDGSDFHWTWGEPDGAYYQRWPLNAQDQAVSGDPDTAPTEPMFFMVVASHELGHAVNLAHVSDGGARMEDRQPSGGWFHQAPIDEQVTPLADDEAGVRSLYPAFASGSDLYLISWADVPFSADPDSGVDSWPTSAYGTPGGDLLAFPRNRVRRGSGRDRLEVWRGDTVDIRVCIGNQGPEDVDFDHIGGLEFFLSQDRTIGTDDARSPTRQLFTGTLDAGEVSCGVYAFLVPYDVGAGRWYYVGTWIDRGQTQGAPRTNDITINNRRLYVSQ